jgi:hypothetical protein
MQVDVNAFPHAHHSDTQIAHRQHPINDQPLLKHIPKAGDNTSAATVNQKMHTEQSITLGAHTTEMLPASSTKMHHIALRTT